MDKMQYETMGIFKPVIDQISQISKPICKEAKCLQKPEYRLEIIIVCTAIRTLITVQFINEPNMYIRSYYQLW